jgi:hypothetical protein
MDGVRWTKHGWADFGSQLVVLAGRGLFVDGCRVSIDCDWVDYVIYCV